MKAALGPQGGAASKTICDISGDKSRFRLGSSSVPRAEVGWHTERMDEHGEVELNASP